MKNVIKNVQNWMENSVIDELMIIVILIAIVESLAQNMLKKSNDSSLNFLLGLLAYIMVGVLLHYAYNKFSSSKVNVLWTSTSIVFATTLGYFLYDEPMNVKNIFAVLFALLAVISSYLA